MSSSQYRSTSENFSHRNEEFLKGNEYEKLSLVLLAKKAYKLSKRSHFCNFAIGREVAHDGDSKLGDIVFTYEKGTSLNDQNVINFVKDEDARRNIIFVQIKHKEDESQKINSDILIQAEGSGNLGRDFNLRQYFKSFRNFKDAMIKGDVSEKLKNGTIKYVVLFTNIDLDREDLNNEAKGFRLREAPYDVEELFTMKKPFRKQDHYKQCYQLSKVSGDLLRMFEKCCDLHILARELAQYAVSKKYKNYFMGIDRGLIQHYHVALGKEVIKKSNTFDSKSPTILNEDNKLFFYARFREEFIDSNKSGPKKDLKHAMFDAIKEKIDKTMTDKDLKECLKKVEWKIIPTFGQSNNSMERLPAKWKESNESELFEVAAELTSYVISESHRNKNIFGSGITPIKQYEFVFQREIIKIACVARFREDFINTDEKDGGKGKLLNAIIAAVRELDQSKESISDDDLKKYLAEAELKVVIDFGEGENGVMEIPDKWKLVDESDITEFLNCLVFSVRQPNVMDLLTQVYSEIESLFDGTGFGKALDVMNPRFRDRIEKTIGTFKRTTYSEKWISGEDIISFVEELHEAINASICTEIYEDKVMQYGCFDIEKLDKLETILENFLKYECDEEITERLKRKANNKEKQIKNMEIKTKLNENKILCVCTTIPFLSAVKILQCLNVKHHRDKHGQISVELNDLKNEKFIGRIEKAFKSECHNLLTIECTDAVNERLVEIYFRFSKIIISKPNKKMILIIKQDHLDNLTEKIKKNPKCNKYFDPDKIFDTIIIKDFQPKKDPFTKKMIVFQGQKEKLSLDNLIGIKDWKSYVTDPCSVEIPNDEGIINAKTLVEIFQNDEIAVGSRPLGTDSLECAYFSLPEEISEINKENLTVQQVLECDSNVMYIISGVNGSNRNDKICKPIQYLGLVNEQEKIEWYSGDINSKSKIVVVEDQFKEETFKSICHRHPEKEIFWFYTKKENSLKLKKIFNPNFYLKRNFKTIIPKKTVNHEQHQMFLVEEDELIEEINDRKFIIITDDPGMGKSVTITKLCESKHLSKSFLETHWIIRISLIHQIQAIKNIELFKRITDVVKFLSGIDSELDNRVTKYLLEFALNKRKTISKSLLLVLDGFGEISNEDEREKVISLLKFLKEETAAKVWITTGPLYKDLLEDTLSLFALEFDPINYEEYIKMYLKDRMQLILSKETFDKIFDERKTNSTIQKYVKAFCKKIELFFPDNAGRFLGTPLHLYILLDNSVKYFKHWIENGANENLNFDYLGGDVREVYETFINRKLDVYFQKTDCKTRQEIQFIFDNCNKSLVKCLIFKSEPRSEKWLKVFKHKVSLAGIINYYGNNIKFTVASLRDFFAAKLFTDWIKNESHDFLPGTENEEYLLKKILKEPEFKLIRTFLNLELKFCFTLKDGAEDWFQERLKHYGRLVLKISQHKPNVLIDEKGSFLHVAVEEGNRNIVRFILESLKVHKEILKELLLARDRHETTVLCLACNSRNYKTFDLLKKAASSVGISEEVIKKVNSDFESNLLTSVFEEFKIGYL